MVVFEGIYTKGLHFLDKKNFKIRNPVTEVDVFTIIMAKTVEYFTKAYPNLKYKNEPITLSQVPHKMKNFSDHITGSAERSKNFIKIL